MKIRICDICAKKFALMDKIYCIPVEYLSWIFPVRIDVCEKCYDMMMYYIKTRGTCK